MSYIKHNVNLYLLILIVVMVLGLVGITAYYQLTYKELSDDYVDKVSSLNRLSKQLSTQDKELNETKTDLKLREEDTEQFEELYGEVLGEKKGIELELKDTSEDLKDTLFRLQQSLAEAASLNASVKSKNREIKNLKSDIVELEEKVCAIQSQQNLSQESYC